MTPIRVLVVDDYEPICRSIRSILPNSRFQIIGQAADGLEAVQKSADLQPDLILLDIGLPQLNGIKAAEQISKVAPHSKILFVSQETDPSVIELALSLGTGCVSKGCIQRDLLPAIASVQRLIGNGQDDSTDKGNAQVTHQPAPYRFGFDSTNRILHGCFERFVSKQELRNYYQTAVKHVARLSPNSYILDVSAVTSTTVTTGTILEFAKLPPLLPGAQRHRFIVAARSAAFWLMRTYAAAAVRTSRRNLHVVKKHAEAWAILGISEPRFDPLPDDADGEAPSFAS
jgi:CheY-like chemotaxis protein